MLTCAIRLVLLIAVHVPGPGAAGRDPDAPLDDPLPQNPKARLGTTRYRNVWSDSPFALAPDGRTLATVTGDKRLTFVDVASGKVAPREPQKRIQNGRAEYLPDGKRIAVQTHDGVSVIEYETGRTREVRFENTYYRPQAVVSADGTRVAVPNNTFPLPKRERKGIAVTVWDADAAKKVCTVQAVQNDLVCASLAADGKVLATWGRYVPPGNSRNVTEAQEYTVEVWDAETGKARCQLVLGGINSAPFDPDGFALTATVAPDGKQVAVAVAASGGVEFFDTATGKSVHRFASRGAPVKRLVYAPDGLALAAIGYDGAVQVWDLQTRKRLGLTESPVETVSGVVFPEPGRVLAWGMDGYTVVVWDATTGARVVAPEGHSRAITSIVFSGDGKTVHTAGADRTVATWDAATGKLLTAARLKLPARADPERRQTGDVPGWGVPDLTVLSPDGKRVAVATNSSSPSELLVLDRATGTELLGLKTGYIVWRSFMGPAFTADGTRVFYPPADLPARVRKEYTTAVWDIGTGCPLGAVPLLDGSAGDSPFALSPSGAHLVRMTYDRAPKGEKASRVLRSWNCATGASVAERVVSTEPGFTTPCWLAVGSDGRTAVVGIDSIGGSADERQLFTWDYTTGKVLKTVSLADGFETSGPGAVNPDGKTFVAVGQLREKYGDRTVIRVYDLATGEVRRDLVGSSRWVTALAFSPDGKTLASGSHDTTVLLWDLSTLPGPK